MTARRTRNGRVGGGITVNGDKNAEPQISSDLEKALSRSMGSHAGLQSQSITGVLGCGGGRVGIQYKGRCPRKLCSGIPGSLGGCGNSVCVCVWSLAAVEGYAYLETDPSNSACVRACVRVIICELGMCLHYHQERVESLRHRDLSVLGSRHHVPTPHLRRPEQRPLWNKPGEEPEES